jgi:hypothetical protein
VVPLVAGGLVLALGLSAAFLSREVFDRGPWWWAWAAGWLCVLAWSLWGLWVLLPVPATGSGS